nr:Gfo/Idh/MocA family oxidoreductase [Streptomyces chartreusis]
MRSIDKVRFGIVGLGAHAQENLVPALLSRPGAQINAICSRSKARAKSLSDNWGVAYTFDSVDDLLRSGEVDAVVAATPPDVHATVTLAALHEGVHVFVEKPPAPSAPRLDEVIREAVKRPEITTFVDYNFRFSQGYMDLLRSLGGVDGVRICRVRLVTSKPTVCLWGYESIVESYLWAVGVHAIEQACHLLGKATATRASLVRLTQKNFSISTFIEFPGDRCAILDLGNYSNRLEYSCELVKEDLTVGTLDNFKEVRLSGHAKGRTSSISPKEVIRYHLSGLLPGYQVAGYGRAFDAFLDEVRGVSTEASSPVAKSREVYAIVESILREMHSPQ